MSAAFAGVAAVGTAVGAGLGFWEAVAVGAAVGFCEGGAVEVAVGTGVAVELEPTAGIAVATPELAPAVALGADDAGAAVVTTTRTGEICCEGVVAGRADELPPPLHPATNGTSVQAMRMSEDGRIVDLPTVSVAEHSLVRKFACGATTIRFMCARCQRAVSHATKTRLDAV